MAAHVEQSPQRLWVCLAWMVWSLVVGLSLATFAHKIPSYFQLQLDQAERAEAGLRALGLAISPVASAWWITVRDVLVAVVSLTIGLTLVRLAPNSRRMLFFSAVIVTTGVSLPNVLRLAPAAPEWEPLALLVRYFAYNLFILALFVFPRGRVEPRWLWPFIGLWPLVTVFTLLGQQFVPEQASTLEGLHQILSIPWLLVGLWVQITRYRERSNALERQQTRWVITGFVGLCLGGLLLNLIYIYYLRVSYEPAVARTFHSLVAISLLGFPPAIFMPLAIGFSVARYRLWDLGDLLHRSLLYGLTTILSLGLWIGLFGMLEMLMAFWIGPRSNLAVMISTLVIAALIQPLRLRLKALIDWGLYRQQVDFDQALAHLATELRSQVELRDIVQLLLERTRQLLFVHWAELHLDDGTGVMGFYHSLPESEGHFDPRGLEGPPQLAAGAPFTVTGSTASLLVPLLAKTSAGTRSVGVLVLGPRKSGEGYPRRTCDALQALAQEAGIAIHVVTLIHRHREERERLIRELEARTAEIEEFLTVASHELRSPLFTIQGHLGILRRACQGQGPGVERSIGRIAHAAETLGLQLEAILRIAQCDRHETTPREVPLDSLASEAVEKVLGTRNAAVEVSSPLPKVYGHRRLLLELLVGLIDNAVKFSPVSKSGPQILLGSETVEGWAHCFIRDRGPGIEPTYRERVFRLFEQLDPSSPGIGAGLPLARRILEAHGGRIWIESQGGEGCTVRFTLPVATG